MTDNLDIIRTYSQTLSDTELSQAWRILYNEYKKRGESNAAKIRSTLRVGDHVSWVGHNGAQVGEITKVKRKKCLIFEIINGKPDPNRCWDVPMSMIQIISK